ncbi:MAG: hypothetical protein ABJN95_04520 [Maribacter sp.]|uniref:hypothetical protein n=1 Tax=Maribacter sp. TaxID=1897614 RepID=UPI0032969094
MTAFEDLRSEWGNQGQPEVPKDGAKQILKKITAVRKKQRITNYVLAVTASVLIAFFFYVSAYKYQSVMIGLLLMIGALVLRIGLEFSNLRNLKNMDVLTTAEKFKQQMIRYYNARTKVHFILTPIAFLIYIVGFVMLLPAFKDNLSAGFYNYIIVSAIVSLGVLCLFIAREVKKELQVLKELKA